MAGGGVWEAGMCVIWGAMGNRGRGRQGCGVWPVACGHWHLGPLLW